MATLGSIGDCKSLISEDWIKNPIQPGDEFIIKRIETPAALLLDEGYRLNHFGDLLITKGALSTEPANDIDYQDINNWNDQIRKEMKQEKGKDEEKPTE